MYIICPVKASRAYFACPRFVSSFSPWLNVSTGRRLHNVDLSSRTCECTQPNAQAVPNLPSAGKIHSRDE